MFKSHLLVTFFIAITFANLAWAAQESNAKIVSIKNPSKSVGIQIGDLLKREIEIEVLKPYQIHKNAFPVKGANQDGIELSAINVESKTSEQKTTYKIGLTYQVFAYSAKPTVRQLPAERFAVTANSQTDKNQAASSMNIPAWRFWQTSLVPTGLQNAKEHVQPQTKPTLINLRQHQISLIAFISLFIIGAIGLVYINADKHWLPLMNGAFAQAHRNIKKVGKNKMGEQKALLTMHQAFNQIHGANLFAGDIQAFVTANPAYAAMESDIINFFERSNATLFSDQHSSNQNENSAAHINTLITLSKKLRNCERGVK